MSKIQFTKMHGCGNDYIYVNAMLYDIPDPAEAARKWSDRHKGIGSDGLVLIGKSPVPEADFSMRIFNADGSEAMMCGNASRCIGKYLYDRGITTQTQIRLLTLSGVKKLALHVVPAHVAGASPDEGSAQPLGVTSVTVDMGEPVFEDASQFLPSRGLTKAALELNQNDARISSAEREQARQKVKGTFVSMGNPHYVIFTDDVDQVGEAGRTLEYHPAFPQRCNIEFARMEDRNADSPPSGGQGADCAVIRTRVWERGSGITQACGTGACATAVAAVLTGKAGRTSQIVMDGGTLSIEWRESDNHVYMTGPAAFVFDGFIELPDTQTNPKL